MHRRVVLHHVDGHVRVHSHGTQFAHQALNNPPSAWQLQSPHGRRKKKKRERTTRKKINVGVSHAMRAFCPVIIPVLASFPSHHHSLLVISPIPSSFLPHHHSYLTLFLSQPAYFLIHIPASASFPSWHQCPTSTDAMCNNCKTH